MKITKISQQKRRDGRVNVFLDDTYDFSVSKNDLIYLGLYRGQEISEKDLKSIKDTAQRGRCLAKAYDYLARRPHSEKELRDKLRLKDFTDAEIDSIFEQLRSLNFLNDTEFTLAWIRNRNSLKPKGKKALSLELMKKGVDKEIINSALRDITFEKELVSARELLQTRYKNKDFDREKAFNYLSSRGYEYEVIKRTLEDYMKAKSSS